MAIGHVLSGNTEIVTADSEAALLRYIESEGLMSNLLLFVNQTATAYLSRED